MMWLRHLFQFVSLAFPVTKVDYPSIPNWRRDATAYMLKHAMLHQMKAVGEMAAIIEPMDHGHDLDRTKLLVAVRKSLLDTIQVAGLADITYMELEAEIRNFSKELEISEDWMTVPNTIESPV